MSRIPVAVCLLALSAGLAACGGGSGGSTEVAPQGAPYSYSVPDGFEVGKPSFPGKQPRFLTTVVPAGTSGRGYLGIYEVSLSGSERRLSSRRLLSRFDKVERVFYRGAGAALSAGREMTVAGHPALCWRIHHFDNPYEGLIEADSCAIAAGHRLLLQTCTWKPQTADVIHRGCAAMRASLEVPL